MSIELGTHEQRSAKSADADNRDAKINCDFSHLSKRVLTAVTSRQAALVAKIVALRATLGGWPSGVAVARALGLNATTVYRRLKKLVRIGVLSWIDGVVRVVRQVDGVFMAPSEVGAGRFSTPADSQIASENAGSGHSCLT